MDKKKRRSSIKRTVTDENTVPIVGRAKRISFSGKKSVRVFCGDEEPKTWDNSYDVSDSNASEGADATHKANALQVSAATFPSLTEAPNMLQMKNDKCSSNCGLEQHKHVFNSSDLYSTIEYIDKTQQNYSVHCNNTVDITLLKDEHVGQFNQRISVSMEEFELEKLAQNVQKPSRVQETTQLCRNMKKHVNEMQKLSAFNKFMEETINRTQMQRTLIEPVPIHVDKSDTYAGNNKRKTIQKTQDMDISCIKSDQVKPQNKENLTPFQNVKTNDTSSMEIASPMQAEEQKGKLTEETMFLDDFIQTENEHIVHKTVTQNAHNVNKCKTILSEEDMSMQLNDVDQLQEVQRDVKEFATANKRKTIIFDDNQICNEADELKPNFERRVPIQDSVTKKKVVVVRKACTTLIQNSAAKDLEQQRFQRFQQRQKEALATAANYAKANSHERDTDAQGSSFEFSLRSIKNDGDHTLDLSSPALPNGLIASGDKQLNLQQLNDALEHGNINIYSAAQQLMTANRQTPRRMLFSTPSKRAEEKQIENTQLKVRRGTLFANDDMQLSSNESAFNLAIVNDVAAIAKKNKKGMPRYSEADEMLLDNTSYLTKARLGDETVSRNSSKCSRETIPTNADNELDLCDMLPLQTTLQCQTDLDLKHIDSAATKIEHIGTQATQANNAEKPISVGNGSATNLTHTTLSQTLHCMDDMNIDSPCTTVPFSEVEPVLVDDINAAKMNTKQRLTLHFNNDLDIDVDIENSMNVSNIGCLKNDFQQSKKRQTMHYNNKDNDIECESTKTFSNAAHKQILNVAKTMLFKRKTMLTPMKIDVEADDSFAAILQEVRTRTSSGNKRRTIVYNNDNAMDLEESPTLNTSSDYKKNMCLIGGTPHRSIMEFECIEREIKLEEQQQFDAQNVVTPDNLGQQAIDNEIETERKSVINTAAIETKQQMHINILTEKMASDCALRKQSSPINILLDVSGLQPIENEPDGNSSAVQASPAFKALTMKRLTAHLTPNLPQSKKRQTRVFANCELDQSVVHSDDKEAPNAHINKRETLLLPANMVIENSANTAIQVADTTNCDNTANEANTTVSMETTLCGTEINCDEPINASVFNVRQSSIKDVDADIELDITPTRTKSNVSHIPVRVSSAKKSNSMLQHIQSPNANETLDTIELARRANTTYVAHKNSILPTMPTNIDPSIVEVPKQDSAFECNPITISDVSVYCLEQRKSSMAKKFQVKKNTNDSSASEELQMAADNATSRKSLPYTIENNTVNNIKNFHNHYLDLTSNSPGFENEERLSLVELLLVDDEDVDDNDDALNEHGNAQTNNIVENDDDVEIVEVDAAHTPNVAAVDCLSNKRRTYVVQNTSTCRKCKRCQETIMNNTLTNSTISETFVLPAAPPPHELLGLRRLKYLRERPTIADVQEYYRRLSLTQPFSIANLTAEGSYSHIEVINDDYDNDDEDEADPEFEQLLTNLHSCAESTHAQLMTLLQIPTCNVRETVVNRLKTLLGTQNLNWIFDYQMQQRKVLLFSHKKIVTFSIVIAYEETSSLGRDINIKRIALHSKSTRSKNWQPLHYLLDFQMKLEMPFNMDMLCSTSDEFGICEMLQKMNEICNEILSLGFALMRIICNSASNLIREANGLFIHKIVRTSVHKDGEYTRIEKREYRIELTNIRKLCFKDITLPALHLFREEIQYLPTGLEFLRVFLENPNSFLKH